MLPVRQGIRFDPDLPQTLRLEFAKTNTKVVKPKQQLAQLAIAAAAAAAAGHTQYVQPIASRKHIIYHRHHYSICISH